MIAMVGASWNKCRRTSSLRSSPRTAGRKTKNELPASASSSSSSSSSSSHSPMRRRDALRNMVLNVVRPSRTAAAAADHPVSYRGVRYREGLSKYVTEIRPTRSSKKIWLGTYDTAEEAARAFDIGNLCCKKNLPLNFADSPRLLKRISSKLSEEECRSAIAKLAKEVARVVVMKSASEGETTNQEEVSRGAAIKARRSVESTTKDSLPKTEPQIQRLEACGTCSSITYTELPVERLEPVFIFEEEMVTPMSPFDMSGMSLPDNLQEISFCDFDSPSLSSENYGDVYFYRT